MEKKMNVIFLDLDGVMSPQTECNVIVNSSDPNGMRFSTKAVFALSYIMGEAMLYPKPRIVLSSTWRFEGLEAMQQVWKENRLAGEIYDITSLHAADEAIARGASSAECRAIEIKEWLSRHPEVNKFAILDDEPITDPAISAHVIPIEPKVGLTKDKARDVECLFKRSPYQSLCFNFFDNWLKDYKVEHLVEAVRQELTYTQNTAIPTNEYDVLYILEHVTNLAQKDERLALCYGMGALIVLQVDDKHRKRNYAELCGLLCDIAIHLKERELARMLLRVADGLIDYMRDYSYERIDEKYNRLVKQIDEMPEDEVVDNRLWYMEVLFELRRHWALTEQERYYLYPDEDVLNDEPLPPVGVLYFHDENEVAPEENTYATIDLHKHPIDIDGLIKKIKKMSLTHPAIIIDNFQCIRNPHNKPIKLMLEEFAYGTRLRLLVKFFTK